MFRIVLPCLLPDLAASIPFFAVWFVSASLNVEIPFAKRGAVYSGKRGRSTDFEFVDVYANRIRGLKQVQNIISRQYSPLQQETLRLALHHTINTQRYPSSVPAVGHTAAPLHHCTTPYLQHRQRSHSRTPTATAAHTMPGPSEEYAGGLCTLTDSESLEQDDDDSEEVAIKQGGGRKRKHVQTAKPKLPAAFQAAWDV